MLKNRRDRTDCICGKKLVVGANGIHPSFFYVVKYGRRVKTIPLVGGDTAWILAMFLQTLRC